MGPVRFVTTTSEVYSGITSKDEDTLYFISDERRIYKGDVPYSGGIFTTVAEFPETGEVNTLYVNSATGEVRYYNGTSYQTVVPATGKSITGNGDGSLATTAAVAAYVTSQTSSIQTQLNGFDGRITANANAIEAEMTNRIAAVTAETERAQGAEQTLQNGINAILEYSTTIDCLPPVFNTVYDAIKAKNLKAGQTIITLGFNSINDNGGCVYIVTDSGTPNYRTIIPTANNKYLTMVQNSSTIYVEQVQSIVDKDITSAFQYAVDNYNKIIANNTYIITKPIIISKKQTIIDMSKSTINSDFNDYIFNINNFDITLKTGTITNTGGAINVYASDIPIYGISIEFYGPITTTNKPVLNMDSSHATKTNVGVSYVYINGNGHKLKTLGDANTFDYSINTSFWYWITEVHVSNCVFRDGVYYVSAKNTSSDPRSEITENYFDSCGFEHEIPATRTSNYIYMSNARIFYTNIRAEEYYEDEEIVNLNNAKGSLQVTGIVPLINIKAKDSHFYISTTYNYISVTHEKRALATKAYINNEYIYLLDSLVSTENVSNITNLGFNVIGSTSFTPIPSTLTVNSTRSIYFKKFTKLFPNTTYIISLNNITTWEQIITFIDIDDSTNTIPISVPANKSITIAYQAFNSTKPILQL